MKFKVVKLTKEGIPFHKWVIVDRKDFDKHGVISNYIDSFGKVISLDAHGAWCFYNWHDPMEYTGFQTRDQARAVLKRYQLSQTSFCSKVKNYFCRRLSLPLWYVK
jgi:hypothetical protein